MPPRDRRVRIHDIIEAIEKIARYVDGMGFEQFTQDPRTIDAVVMNFIIIGEAASHPPDEVIDRHADEGVPRRLMRGMRNTVVHECWGVSHRIVGETATSDLPPLIEKLRGIAGVA